MNSRPNVFEKILLPTVRKQCGSSLQLECHFRASKQYTRFTILLNNMRLMGIFDWLLAVHEYITTKPPDPFHEGEWLLDYSKV